MLRRIIRIVLAPQREWRRIAAEPGGAANAVFVHALVLAALATSVGWFDPPLSVKSGTEDVTGLLWKNLLTYWMPVPVLALVQLGLARFFGIRASWRAAAKVAAYAPTPFWLAAPLAAVPTLAIMPVAGLVHMLYLQYVAAHEVFGIPLSECAQFVAMSAAGAFMLLTLASAFTGTLGGV